MLKSNGQYIMCNNAQCSYSQSRQLSFRFICLSRIMLPIIWSRKRRRRRLVRYQFLPFFSSHFCMPLASSPLAQNLPISLQPNPPPGAPCGTEEIGNFCWINQSGISICSKHEDLTAKQPLATRHMAHNGGSPSICCLIIVAQGLVAISTEKFFTKTSSSATSEQ